MKLSYGFRKHEKVWIINLILKMFNLTYIITQGFYSFNSKDVKSYLLLQKKWLKIIGWISKKNSITVFFCDADTVYSFPLKAFYAYFPKGQKLL